MPKNGIAPHHRVDAALHELAREKASQAGVSLSYVAERGLIAYIDGRLHVPAAQTTELPASFKSDLIRLHQSKSTQLNQALRNAQESGWSSTTLATALGMSRQAVHLRIAKASQETTPDSSGIAIPTAQNARFDWAFWISPDIYGRAAAKARDEKHSMTAVMNAVLRRFTTVAQEVSGADESTHAPLATKAS